MLPPGHPEGDVHHAALGLVQAQHPAHQQGTHVLHRGPDGNALFAVHVPVFRRVGSVRESVLRHAAGFQPAVNRLRGGAFHDHAAQVAFDIAQKNRDPHVRKAFRQHLQGYGFARSGGACDQAVTVCHGGKQVDRCFSAGTDPDFPFMEHGRPSRFPVPVFFSVIVHTFPRNVKIFKGFNLGFSCNQSAGRRQKSARLALCSRPVYLTNQIPSIHDNLRGFVPSTMTSCNLFRRRSLRFHRM